MELTPDAVEREYNNRALVPDHPAYFARWESDSMFVRETLAGKLDIPYGSDPRHRIDLFPSPGSPRLLIFIHGGYWRSLDKSYFSWLASSWVAAGVNVALPNYRLCPSVRIEEIVEDIIAATNWLFATGPAYGVRTERVVVSGHSAGGHLTGALFAASPEALHFNPEHIVGGVPVSGLFDFAPLPFFSGNADLRLDEAQVKRLNLYDRRPAIAAPLVVAVGANESSEFQRQSKLIVDSWKPHVTDLLVMPGLNHFSVVDAFAERGNTLYESTLDLF